MPDDLNTVGDLVEYLQIFSPDTPVMIIAEDEVFPVEMAGILFGLDDEFYDDDEGLEDPQEICALTFGGEHESD